MNFAMELLLRNCPAIQRRSVADFLQRKGIINHVVQAGVDFADESKKQQLKAKLLPHQLITGNIMALVR
jgi:hypothetical protein